jgi:hypothetical protein
VRPGKEGKSDGKKIQLFSNAFPSNSKFKNAAYSTLNFFFFVVFFLPTQKGKSDGKKIQLFSNAFSFEF